MFYVENTKNVNFILAQNDNDKHRRLHCHFNTKLSGSLMADSGIGKCQENATYQNALCLP